MATEIKMPQLSDTMDSGKILSWSKSEGDTVSRGDILAEVETDKANLEIESFHEGVLLKILTQADQTAQVGEIIAYIGQPGEEVTGTKSSPPAAEAASTPIESNGSSTSGHSVVSKTSSSPPPSSHPTSNLSGRIKASPLAKKMAQQKNIDLSQVQGSGPDGRIVKRDLENLTQSSSSASASSAQQAPTPKAASGEVQPQQRSASTGPVGGKLTPLTKVRETIARRMQQSVTEAPHFYVTTTVDMEESVRLRAKLKEVPEYKGISINHLIIKAVAYGIAREPRVNRAIRDDLMMFEPDEINVGIITAVDDGLLIPVVRTADKLSLRDVVFEARAAVDRARAGRPNSSDLVGGTFSISNMGMFDVENFTAIINPGQGSVLAVSSTQEVPVVKRGAIVPGLQMKATISVDHRIIDGVMAGEFLKHFRSALESPALLMV